VGKGRYPRIGNGYMKSVLSQALLSTIS